MSAKNKGKKEMRILNSLEELEQLLLSKESLRVSQLSFLLHKQFRFYSEPGLFGVYDNDDSEHRVFAVIEANYKKIMFLEGKVAKIILDSYTRSLEAIYKRREK